MKKTNQNGITLVALVITIIILLILAGISIQAITNTGLFAQTNKTKKETQRAQVAEWLNLKLMEEQMHNPTGTADEIIEATRENAYDNINQLKTIGKEVIVEDTKTEEDGEQVDIFFYVQVDEDVYKVDMEGTKYVGEAGKFPPVIKLESITSTTNSITVKIKTIRNEEGKLEVYKKLENDSDYTLEKTATGEEAKGLEYTFTGLEQNKKYSIKIVATAPNGQKTERIEITTKQLTYTIEYNGNGNTGGSTQSSTHEYEVEKELTVNGYIKTGYEFKGWATSSDGEVIYTDGQKVRNLSNTNGETIILYAVWELKNIEIYDDFSNNNLDTSKWEIFTTGSGGSYTLSNGIINLIGSYGNNTGFRSCYKVTGNEKTIEVSYTVSSEGGTYYEAYHNFIDNTGHLLNSIYPNNKYMMYWKNGTYTGITSYNPPYPYKLKWIYSNNNIYIHLNNNLIYTIPIEITSYIGNNIFSIIPGSYNGLNKESSIGISEISILVNY